MQINSEFLTAKVVKVYNSLIVDAKLSDGTVVPVFGGSGETMPMCPKNTSILISPRRQALQKIPYELQFIITPEGPVFVNPSYSRCLVKEAFDNGIVKDFSTYNICREIVAEDHLTHVDFELSDSSGNKCYVFIKHLYFKTGGCTYFPFGMNFFEFEMFEELARLRKLGYQTMVFMLVPRMDSSEARFSWKYDPVASAKIFDEAKNGLNFVCYGCNFDKNSVTIAHQMQIIY